VTPSERVWSIAVGILGQVCDLRQRTAAVPGENGTIKATHLSCAWLPKNAISPARRLELLVAELVLVADPTVGRTEVEWHL
jgi:hypothetical protein